MQGKLIMAGTLTVLLMTVGGCASRSPPPRMVEPVPPLSTQAWFEIKEQIWTASTLAQSEAESYARQAMHAWMLRVRERTENDFVPWYSGYWTQQWIGFKAGWHEATKEDGEVPVEEYLVEYLEERFYELVLEPAGMEANPQTVTEHAAALYVRLLSEQLQCLPKMHTVPLPSLRAKLEHIPLITLPGSPPVHAPLSLVLERSDLAGEPAFEALIAHASSAGDPQNASPNKDRLQAVAQDSVARLVAKLPVRAGGSAVAMVVGEALGLFISAGVAVWSAASHGQEQPEIELRLRKALDVGLGEMWQTLMEDPELGVLFPVNHMTRQIEVGLFPTYEPVPVVPF